MLSLLDVLLLEVRCGAKFANAMRRVCWNQWFVMWLEITLATVLKKQRCMARAWQARILSCAFVFASASPPELSADSLLGQICAQTKGQRTRKRWRGPGDWRNPAWLDGVWAKMC